MVEHAAVLAGNVEVIDLVIYPNGFLRFQSDVNSQLNIGTLQVPVGGKLEIGRLSNPISSNALVEIVFANRAIDLNVDPGQCGQGLLVAHHKQSPSTLASAIKNRQCSGAMREITTTAS